METTNATPETTATSTTEEAKARRPHRTPDQQIADLLAKAEQVKLRAQAKEAKQAVVSSPEGDAILGAVQAIDRAIRLAVDSDNLEMQDKLEAARAPLGIYAADAFGIRLPAPRLKVGGRKPKNAATAETATSAKA